MSRKRKKQSKRELKLRKTYAFYPSLIKWIESFSLRNEITETQVVTDALKFYRAKIEKLVATEQLKLKPRD